VEEGVIATAVGHGSVAGVGIEGQDWSVAMAAFLEPEEQVR
jgi:hypothetical protein